MIINLNDLRVDYRIASSSGSDVLTQVVLYVLLNKDW